MLLTAKARASANQQICLDGGEPRWIVALDGIEGTLQAAVLVVDAHTRTDGLIGNLVAYFLGEDAAQALIFVVDVARRRRRIDILRQRQYLRILLGKVAAPDTGHVLGGVADGLREESAEALERTVEAQFRGAATDGADKRANTRIGVAHLDMVTTTIERVGPQPSGMD